MGANTTTALGPVPRALRKCLSIRRVRWHTAAMLSPRQPENRHRARSGASSWVVSEPAPWQPHRQTRSEIPHEPPGSGCAGRTNVRGPDPFATAGTVQHPAGAPPLPPHVRSRIRISHRFFPLRNIDAPLEYPRRPVTVRSRRTAEPFEDRKGQPIANGHRGGAMPMGADGTLPGPEHAAVGTPIAT